MTGAGLGRWIAELRAAPTDREVRAALARLRVRRQGDVAEIGPGDGAPLDSLDDAFVSVVRLARGAYASVPASDGRVRLLELARGAARDVVQVHVVVSDDQSHLGRLAFDAPRRVLRAVGVHVAEPGDRFGPDRFAHCFFDEEGFLLELDRAGLVVASRRGFDFTLRRREPHERAASSERAAATSAEVGRVVRLVREVDARRASGAPQEVLATMRARGASAEERGPIGRARLRRAIGWVDAFMPGGANCYRRILLESALDAGAARETVVFGLDVGSTGHVAFEGREERSFDVAFAIPATQP
jgi:hypothetical protein